MDSGEEYSVDEELAGSGSDVAETEQVASQGFYSNVKEGDVSSLYEPSDDEIVFKTEPGWSQDDGLGNRSPLKRAAEETQAFRPFKRQKGSLNVEYLDLLNRDIEDASHRVCLRDYAELQDSQLGLTFWSAVEKHQFFEALSRLGRHDLPGIARRVGSKSQVEVKHYIDALRTAKITRKERDRRAFLVSAEYPASVEISQQCCHAQEEAADTISVLQEQREDQREEAKWGQNWDITQSLARRSRSEDDDDLSESLPFAKLFHTSSWLKLSERLFMNSSIPGNNWNYIDDRHPSIWATAFEDFHSLAVSITRRLVQSTLFISMSRIRAKKELIPTTRNVVRRKDVEAAVASLGLTLNSHKHWIECARRLRLDVYQDPPKGNDEAEDEPMAYEQVESALSEGTDMKEVTTSQPEYHNPDSHYSDDEDEDAYDDYETGNETEEGRNLDYEEYEVAQEANEVLWYSAADLRDVQSARQALQLRIAMERQQESQAELHDEHASTLAEAEMWGILQKKPPMELPRKQHPGKVTRSNLDVNSIYPLGRDWAARLEFFDEWETLDHSQDV